MDKRVSSLFVSTITILSRYSDTSPAELNHGHQNTERDAQSFYEAELSQRIANALRG